MKLISSTQIAWSEPYFFLIRLREPWGWRRRGLLALAIAAVMFLAIHFTGQGRLTPLEAAGLSLAAGLVLVAMMDVGNIQREVTIKEDCIIYNSAAGTLWMGTFKFKDIHEVHLMRPEDWNRPWGAMLVQTADDTFLLGVPNKISLPTVADILHRLGVRVQLAGWTPSETDTRVQVMQEVVLTSNAPQGEARIWPVGEHEGRLSPPLATAVALVLALGPLLASLLGLIAAGVYVYLHWSTLSWLQIGMIGGAAFAALVAGFVYLLLAGQFLAARYQIHVAKEVLRTRPQARFNGSEEDLIPVEIFDRTAWTSMIVKSVDFGFLQVDASRRLLKLEGDKNRWEIPISALTACRIEEAHVGSEGNPNAEKRYYVVIAADHAGQPWEAGMIHTRTQLGNDNAEARYERAAALFSRISQVVSPVSQPGVPAHA